MPNGSIERSGTRCRSTQTVAFVCCVRPRRGACDGRRLELRAEVDRSRHLPSLARSRQRRNAAGALYIALIELPHFIIERRMLLGIKQRAESSRKPGADAMDTTRTRIIGGVGLAAGLAAGAYPAAAPAPMPDLGGDARRGRPTAPGRRAARHAPTSSRPAPITIDAPPHAVWPWLVQMGSDRGGAYTYDWMENLFGLDMHSANDRAAGVPGRQGRRRLPARARRPAAPRRGPGARALARLPVRGCKLGMELQPRPPENGSTRLVSRNRIATPNASVAQTSPQRPAHGTGQPGDGAKDAPGHQAAGGRLARPDAEPSARSTEKDRRRRQPKRRWICTGCRWERAASRPVERAGVRGGGGAAASSGGCAVSTTLRSRCGSRTQDAT